MIMYSIIFLNITHATQTIMINVHLSSTNGRIAAKLTVVNNARVVVTTPSNKVLMVGTKLPAVPRKYREPALTQYDRLTLKESVIVYNIPGGQVNKHDKSLEGAALRELFEETLDQSKIHPYPIDGEMDFIRQYTDGETIVFCYRTRHEPERESYMINNPEVDVVKWIDVNDLSVATKNKDRWLHEGQTRISVRCKSVIKRWVSLQKAISKNTRPKSP